ncbi:MAG: lipoprotein [Alphaproteobacteria bacterium]
MKKPLLFAIALLALAGCVDSAETYHAQRFDFATQPSVRINVARVKVVNAYRPPLAAPNVEQDFPTPPAKAVALWVRQRLQAAGTQGVLEVTIDDASVRENKLPVDKSVSGFFTDQQTSRLDARLHVTLRLYTGGDAMSAASGDITVTRSVTLNRKASVTDRERAFDDMVAAMMTDFDMQAHDRLNSYFKAYML